MNLRQPHKNDLANKLHRGGYWLQIKFILATKWELYFHAAKLVNKRQWGVKVTAMSWGCGSVQDSPGVGFLKGVGVP